MFHDIHPEQILFDFPMADCRNGLKSRKDCQFLPRDWHRGSIRKERLSGFFLSKQHAEVLHPEFAGTIRRNRAEIHRLFEYPRIGMRGKSLF